MSRWCALLLSSSSPRPVILEVDMFHKSRVVEDPSTRTHGIDLIVILI